MTYDLVTPKFAGGQTTNLNMCDKPRDSWGAKRVLRILDLQLNIDLLGAHGLLGYVRNVRPFGRCGD